MIFDPALRSDPSLESALFRADGARRRILLVPLNPRAENALRFEAAVQSTHHSTAIEGNPLTLEEVRALLSGKPLVQPRDRDREVRNYKTARDWIRSHWVGSSAPITAQVVLELHALVMRDLELKARLWKWRLDPVFVFDTRTEMPVHEGDPVAEVGERVKALCLWLTKTRLTLPTVVRAAVAHLEFVRIHPFMDGNGRTARLLETLLLAQMGWDARGMQSLEGYYRRDLPRYYASIEQCIKTRDFTTWTTYIAEGVASSLEHLETQVTQPDLSTPVEPLNDRQWLILSLLERPGSFMSNADAQRTTGATSVTAARDLAGLVQLGLLERRGQGRATHYVRIH